MTSTILQGDALTVLKTLPDASVHCVVTSPPYWGLRDYGVDGQIGLERTINGYVEAIVGVFWEVRRVLHDSGTAWLNLGDTYAGGGNNRGNNSPISAKQASNAGAIGQCAGLPKNVSPRAIGFKPKDLCGIPWRTALALQADGWWLRQDIIWHKPNPMPSSVRDRCTAAHEYLFLLSKSPRYYWDWLSAQEPAVCAGQNRGGSKRRYSQNNAGMDNRQYATRNRRSVWSIIPATFHGAHFATFPVDLVRPCLEIGTSTGGVCPKCLAPLKRKVERTGGPPTGDHRGRPDFDENCKTAHPTGTVAGSALSKVYAKYGYAQHETVGWDRTCQCFESDPIPATVLDPFMGSGTVGVVAKELGRSFIGIDLSQEYCDMAQKRIAGESA